MHPPLSPLESRSIVRVLAPGELLFRQGDRATAIYKVESGRLRLIRRTVDDHLVILHTARRGEFFAEASLFAEAYHCDAVADAQSRVRVYPKAIVMEALRTDPSLAEAFMARLAATPTGDANVPSAEVVWWKARMLARWDAERKVQKPLDVMEPVQIVAGLVAAGLLLAWSLPSLLRILTQLSN